MAMQCLSKAFGKALMKCFNKHSLNLIRSVLKALQSQHYIIWSSLWDLEVILGTILEIQNGYLGAPWNPWSGGAIHMHGDKGYVMKQI